MDSKQRIVLLSEELATVELNNAILEEDGVNEEIHRVTKAAAALESVMYLLDDDQKEIPVTPSQREMGLAAIAVDQAGALMEVPVGDIVASMESYDGTDTGARMIMEDLKERVTAIWKSLIAMLKKLAQWLKDRIGDYVTTVGMLDKRADRIINAVKEGKVSSNGSKPVDDSALKSRLYSPNVNGKAIDTEYRTYTDAMKVALESATVFIKDPSLIKVHEWLKHVNLDKDSMLNTNKTLELMEVVIKAAKNGAKTLFDNREGDAEKFGGIKPAEDCRIYSSPLFLGNIGYYMQCPEKSSSLIHLRFSRYSGEDGQISDLRELNKAQIAVCMTAWKVVKDLKKRFDDAQEILENNAKMVDYLQNRHDNADYWKSNFFRFQLSVARAYITMVSTAALFSPAHLIKVSRDVFRLCEYSLDVSEAGSS